MIARCWGHDVEPYFYPMNESNQRIASINRIDELNQRIAFQKEWAAKTVPKEPKTPSRRPKSPPRRTKNPPRSPLGTVLEPSWDHQTTRSKSRSKIPKLPSLFGSIWGPKTTPQTTPRRSQNESKIKTKNASLFYRSWSRLGSVLRRSWTDLKAHLGSKMWSPL